MCWVIVWPPELPGAHDRGCCQLLLLLSPTISIIVRANPTETRHFCAISERIFGELDANQLCGL